MWAGLPVPGITLVFFWSAHRSKTCQSMSRERTSVQCVRAKHHVNRRANHQANHHATITLIIMLMIKLIIVQTLSGEPPKKEICSKGGANRGTCIAATRHNRNGSAAPLGHVGGTRTCGTVIFCNGCNGCDGCDGCNGCSCGTVFFFAAAISVRVCTVKALACCIIVPWKGPHAVTAMLLRWQCATTSCCQSGAHGLYWIWLTATGASLRTGVVTTVPRHQKERHAFAHNGGATRPTGHNRLRHRRATLDRALAAHRSVLSCRRSYGTIHIRLHPPCDARSGACSTSINTELQASLLDLRT
jgi:hypothetical protein